MISETYDGWVITTGFFTESLGDVDPQDYEDRFRAELELAYPGAEIEITVQRDGSRPPTRVYAPDDRDTREIAVDVEEIGQSAWNEMLIESQA